MWLLGLCARRQPADQSYFSHFSSEIDLGPAIFPGLLDKEISFWVESVRSPNSLSFVSNICLSGPGDWLRARNCVGKMEIAPAEKNSACAREDKSFNFCVYDVSLSLSEQPVFEVLRSRDKVPISARYCILERGKRYSSSGCIKDIGFAWAIFSRPGKVRSFVRMARPFAGKLFFSIEQKKEVDKYLFWDQSIHQSCQSVNNNKETAWANLALEAVKRGYEKLSFVQASISECL
jgi:hypothetical protein